MNDFPIITLITFVPLLGAVALLGLGSANKQLARGLALAFGLVGLALAGILWAQFDASSGELQFKERHEWIPSIGAHYFVGVDGLGLLMVMLTALITPLAILTSWRTERKAVGLFCLGAVFAKRAVRHVYRIKFYPLVLFLGTKPGSGVFPDQTLGWPATQRGGDAVFIYTMVGSVTMLLSFLAIYWTVGTFDFMELAEKGQFGTTGGHDECEAGLV